MATKKKFFLIDGSTFAYRIRHEFIKQPIINSKGMNTTFLLTFVQTLFTILEEENPHYLVAIFDATSPTFRHQLHPEYRTTLEQLPLDILQQMPSLYKLLEAFNIPVIIQQGYEADDILSTYIEQANKIPDLETFIVSGEKNVMQLVNPRVFLYQTKGFSHEIWGVEKIQEKLSLRPDQIVDFLSLMGVPSDHIPGAPDIGERSAFFLLQEYETIENALAHAKTIKRKNIHDSLLKYRETILLSKQLLLLKKEVPLELKITDLKLRQKNETALFHFFQHFEFFQYLSKLSKQKQQQKQDFQLVSSRQDLDRFLKLFHGKKRFSFYFLETDKGPESVLGVAIAFSSSLAYYIPLETENDWVRLQQLKPFFEENTFEKSGFDLKNASYLLQHSQISLKPPVFDILLAGALQNSEKSSYDLRNQILKQLHIILESPHNLKNRYPRGYLTRRQMEIACDYATCIWNLTEYHLEVLKKQKLFGYFENVELKLSSMLFPAEKRGLFLDRDACLPLLHEITELLKVQEQLIYQELGNSFDLTSDEELNQILISKLPSKSEHPKEIKTLQWKDFPENVTIQAILRYRILLDLKKILTSVYYEASSSERQRYSFSFNQIGEPFGQIFTSSLFQQLAWETPEKRNLRQIFIGSTENNVLLSIRYIGLEFSLFAYFSRDPSLRNLAMCPQEISRRLLELVTSSLGKKNCSQKQLMEIFLRFLYKQENKEQESDILSFYQSHFEKFRVWQEHFFEQIQQTGALTTLCGRNKGFPELRSSVKEDVSKAKSKALQYLIQGSISEILKIAVV
ncbi:MAG: DNA polymerase, partial [Planctomycetota bacterium]